MNNSITLKNIPPEIRSWLASAATADEIRRINVELNLQENDIVFIPFLIFKLASKDIEPANFAQELSDWISIPIGSARTIAAEIKEKILTPIASPLKEFGVDISLISQVEDSIKHPVIAPIPPPPPIKISYQPPPPPAMGGSINTNLGGGAVVEIQKTKGKIHIIGDAHEHSANEKIAVDDGVIAPLINQKNIAQNLPVSPALKEEKHSAWPPAPQPTNQTKPEIKKTAAETNTEGEAVPFILHKETPFTPALKPE